MSSPRDSAAAAAAMPSSRDSGLVQSYTLTPVILPRASGAVHLPCACPSRPTRLTRPPPGGVHGRLHDPLAHLRSRRGCRGGSTIRRSFLAAPARPATTPARHPRPPLPETRPGSRSARSPPPPSSRPTAGAATHPARSSVFFVWRCVLGGARQERGYLVGGGSGLLRRPGPPRRWRGCASG